MNSSLVSLESSTNNECYDDSSSTINQTQGATMIDNLSSDDSMAEVVDMLCVSTLSLSHVTTHDDSDTTNNVRRFF